MSSRQPSKRQIDTSPEPIFVAISPNDPELKVAHACAAKTMPQFLAHVLRPGSHRCSAKLSFKDPNESDRIGRDVLVYLWLIVTAYESASKRYIGTFFEVPPELAEWHWVGQELEFESEDVFDWAVNDDGHLQGAFTLRVSRSRLPLAKRKEFDRYVGVKTWAPEPNDA